MLAVELEAVSPAFAALVPEGLGRRDLCAALALARLAYDDARCVDIGTAAGELVRLAGGSVEHDPMWVGEVERSWLTLRGLDVPVLRAWWREDLYLGLLAYWVECRTASVGWPQAEQELRQRWSLDTDDLWRWGLGPKAAPLDAWVDFLTFLEAREGVRSAELARMMASQDEVAAEIAQMTAECADELAQVPHLWFVHQEKSRATALDALARAYLSPPEGVDSPFPPELVAVLRSISDACQEYVRWIEQELAPDLTCLERALLALGTEEAAEEEQQLEAYLRQQDGPRAGVLPTPVFTEEDLAALPPADRGVVLAPAWMDQVADIVPAGQQVGWTDTVGTQPWWIYVVDSGLEAAAALRFKHDGRVRMGHRTADDPHDMLVGFPPDDPDAGLLVMRFAYDDTDPAAMRELLVLARTGHVRLLFLLCDGRRRCRVLRGVSIPIQGELRKSLRRKALSALAALSTPAAVAVAGAGDFFDGTLFRPDDTLF